jgi:hypothetical protein
MNMMSVHNGMRVWNVMLESNEKILRVRGIIITTINFPALLNYVRL